jgi:hypothetical protein
MLPTRRTARRALSAVGVACAAVAALAFGTVRGALAQSGTVDEGAFTVTRGGATLGREEFRIVRPPGGGAFTARATGSYGERRIAPTLQADDQGSPERYQVEVRRGSTVEQRVSAQASGTHFRAQVQAEDGDAAREFVLEPGTVVLDAELYHQYYFLVRRAGAAGAGTRVQVLAPRQGTQRPLWITLDGTERVTVGGQAVEARHYVLTDRAGSRREVWADAQGRILRVLLPAEGLDAVRNDLPR